MHETAFDWNGEDSRAFVPSISLTDATAVVTSSPAGVLESTSPFSIGVYICEDIEGGETTFRPLPLLYVSEKVANDRAKASPSFPPGWYLPLSKSDMGSRFEVRVTTCMAKLGKAVQKEMEGFERVKLAVRINGDTV